MPAAFQRNQTKLDGIKYWYQEQFEVWELDRTSFFIIKSKFETYEFSKGEVRVSLVVHPVVLQAVQLGSCADPGITLAESGIFFADNLH